MIINMNGGGGGKTGATLVVNSSGSGVVTVSNAELGKSYSKAVTMGGSVAFKGLATGTWTVTLSNNIQSTTQSVNVTADYSVAIAYFAATINITYPEGSICTATDGVSTFTAPDTSGTWTLVVPNVGEWTVTITDPTGASNPATKTVTITADGQVESIELDYRFYIFKAGEGAKVSLKTYKETDANLSVGTAAITQSVDSDRTDDYNMFGSLRTTDTIDLSKYSSLCMRCTPSTVYKTSYVGVTSTAFTKGNPEDDSAKWSARTRIVKSTVETTVAVDISAVTTVLYFGYYFAGTNSIKDIWLE